MADDFISDNPQEQAARLPPPDFISDADMAQQTAAPQQAAPDFISDADMQQQAAPQQAAPQQAAPDFISDADMAKPALQAESPTMTTAREAASDIIPTVGAIPAMTAGARLGGVAGLALTGGNPIGGFIGMGVGALGGGLLAGGALAKAQDIVKRVLGFDDTEQRRANAEANPNAAMLGSVPGVVAGFKSGAWKGGAAIASHLATGGFMGGVTAATEAASGEDLSPKAIALSAAEGGVFNEVRGGLPSKLAKLGETVGDRIIRGMRHGTAGPLAAGGVAQDATPPQKNLDGLGNTDTQPGERDSGNDGRFAKKAPTSEGSQAVENVQGGVSQEFQDVLSTLNKDENTGAPAAEAAPPPAAANDNVQGAPEQVTGAAMRDPTGKIEQGQNHSEASNKLSDAGLDGFGADRGYSTSHRPFVDESEAGRIAEAQSQFKPGRATAERGGDPLVSEDINFAPKAPISAKLPSLEAQHAQDIMPSTDAKAQSDALESIKAKQAGQDQPLTAAEEAVPERSAKPATAEEEPLPAGAKQVSYEAPAPSDEYAPADGLMPGVLIRRGHPAPNMVGSNRGNTEALIDPRVPRVIQAKTVEGSATPTKSLDPAQALAIRENARRQVLDMLSKEPDQKMPFATQLEAAKEASMHAERLWLEKRGYDADAFKAQIEGFKTAKPEAKAPVTATVKYPVFVKNALKALRDKGLNDQAVALETQMKGKPPEAQKAIAAAAPAKFLKTRNAENLTAEQLSKPLKNPRLDQGGAEVGDRGYTAKNKTLAAHHDKALKAGEKAFKNNPPVGVDETKAQVLARVTKAIGEAKTANGGKDPISDPVGKYRPKDPDAAWHWLNEAKMFLAGSKSDRMFAKFVSEEAALRGSEADVAEYKTRKRGAGETASNPRGGDKAIAGAEAQRAKNEIGRPTDEGTPIPTDSPYAAAGTIENLQDHVDLARVEAMKEGPNSLGRIGKLQSADKAEAAIKEMRKKFPSETPSEAAEKDTPPVPVQASELIPAARKKELDLATVERAKKADILAEMEPVVGKMINKPDDLTGQPKKALWKTESDDVKARVDDLKANMDKQKRAREARVLAAKTATKPETNAETRTIKLKDGTVEQASVVKGASVGKSVKITPEIEAMYAGKAKVVKEQAQREAELQALERGQKDDPTKNTLSDLGKDEAGSLNLSAIAKTVNAPKSKTYAAKGSRSAEEDYATSMSQDFANLRGGDTHDKLDARQAAKNTPKEVAAIDGKLYKAQDTDTVSSLNVGEKTLFDRWIKPHLDNADIIFAKIEKLEPGLLGPKVANHIWRMRIGGEGDELAPDNLKTGISGDPIEGAINPLYSGKVGPMYERSMVGLERSDGKRFVISPSEKGGFLSWAGGKPHMVTDPSFTFKEGDTYTNGKNKYKMVQATTDEIEAQTGVKYHKSAIMSAIIAEQRLSTILRHLEYIEKQKSSPEFTAGDPRQLATQNAKLAHENGWQTTELKAFKGWFMNPRLAEVMDDFQRPGFGAADSAWDKVRRFSQQVTKLLFWLPTAHFENVGTHWFTARGLEWLRPRGYKSLYLDGSDAMKSVMTQDAFYKEALDKGAGLIYGSTVTQDIVGQVAHAAGLTIKSDPATWGPIAKMFGVGADDMVKGIYSASKHAMWYSNDVFLIQHLKENMRNGMTMEAAITHAEKYFPNYRVASRLMGSRFLSKVMQSPELSAFGRYHAGVWNAYANVAKDLLSPNATGKERAEAVGHLVMMGVLAFGIYPALDKVAQWITNNPDASMYRRGPIAIPNAIARAASGKGDVTQGLRDTFTVPPMATTALEALHNKDYANKNIIEPGDFSNAMHGSGRAAVRVGVQEGLHTAQGLVSPIGTAVNASRNQGIPAAIRDQALGIKNPSVKSRIYEKMAPSKNEQAAITRYARPSNPVEGWLNSILGHK